MMKYFTSLMFLFLLLVLCFPVTAQVRKADFKIHDRGMLWETMKDDGTIGAPDPLDRFQTWPSMDWPGGPHNMIKDDQRSYLFGAGVWMGGYHSDGTLFFTENGPMGYMDEGTFEPITEVENFVGSAQYNPNEAEEVITAQFTTTANIHCRKVSRSWSFSAFNDFIIIEYYFTNKTSGSLHDVWFGFPSLIRPNYQDFVVHNGWGDDLNRSDELVGYDSSRALLYAWDDSPSADLEWDRGNYWLQADELRAPGYAGFALLAAAPAADGRGQPANVFWAQLLDNQIYFTSTNNSLDNMYQLLSGADRSLQANGESPIVPFMLMSCGPYNMEPNETIRIALVEAVNGLPIEEALRGLSAQDKLPAGLDSLKNTVDRAANLFARNYELTFVPPPAPQVDLIPNPREQTITLSWEPLEQTWVNPISGKSDVKEYIIYRSERSFIGPYKKVRRRRQVRVDEAADRASWFKEDINRWVYEDKVDLGVSYFYAVVTTDSAGHSSWLTNRNEQPVRATREPAPNALNVKVFPNPFREVSGFPTSGEENTIVWSNLPAKCTIRIYTSSGELVRRLEHDNPSSGEEIWDQLSDARQRTAPGIYFWTVESAAGNAKGTLLIIK